MRKRALLAMFVVLLLIGAYGAYVVSYPKYQKVDGCVNPFAVVKPVSRAQENWSEAHVFFKLSTTRDFWKLAKPWNVDYSHVKIVKHTIEYNGEEITMLAMGIPLKDKKHVIALYEFSKPVQGVKVKSYLFEIRDNNVTIRKTTTNGYAIQVSSCTHECSSNSDCGYMEQCDPYICSTDWVGVYKCCGESCWIFCLGGIENPLCITCLTTVCPIWCINQNSEFGSRCVPFHR
ncbi:hypothetical protein [Thermococcus thermotolerans]|uniref:hypothetical protein n=1 Tax=Thermococcus thermotolerans TaxID=2969672 RepID=UPI0021572859|nr:hypothetical protein [Thermococcus thermotolerans]